MLRLLSAAAVAVVALAGASGQEGSVFEHGVASGDPLADRVILWTRVTTTDDTPVHLAWSVASDPDFQNEVASGEVTASADDDWTVHVDAGGLDPATTYWYRFEAAGQQSPTGRTRTAPGPNTENIRIGVVSCSSYAAGYFNVYRRLAERDVDLIVHLGDYIYEQPGSKVREHEPAHEAVSLGDYRARHAQYRRDPDLQELHRLHAVAAVWDDHDVAGNGWAGGAAAHDRNRDGSWEERLAAGRRAWTEWLPIRLPDADDAGRIYRHLPLGPLADLVLLDTRFDGRDQQVSTTMADPEAVLNDANRRLMSDQQWQWLRGRLDVRRGQWLLVGNQVMVSPLSISGLPEPLLSIARSIGTVVGDTVINPDQWDGYPAERQRLFDVLAPASPNTVVLTGDIHSSWAAELRNEQRRVGVEVVVPSASSETFAEVIGPSVVDAPNLVTGVFRSEHPEIKWAEIRRHGYAVVELTDDWVHADWWHVPTVEQATAEESAAASWRVAAGEGRLTEADPLEARARVESESGNGERGWRRPVALVPAVGGILAVVATAWLRLSRSRRRASGR